MTPASTRKFPARRDGIYYLDGEEYVSTTDVLTVLAKPALIRWAAKVTAEAILRDPETYDTVEAATAVISQTKGAAGARGTAVHDLIGGWMRDGEAFVPPQDAGPDILGYYQSFRGWVRAWRPTPILSERVLVNKTYKYAGRFDLTAMIGSELWLLDFKTSKAVWAEYGLQLTAYKNGEFYKDEAEVWQPLPPVAKTGVVLLQADGKIAKFEEVDEPFEVFLALMKVHAWSKSK